MKSYDKLGIQFQYPSNWRLDESDALDGYRTVSVYSPGGAFWTVTIHSPDVQPQDLARHALATMKQEYDELDGEAVEEQVAGRQIVGYDINFYCLDLTNTSHVRSFSTPQAAYLLWCQADDREFVRVEEVLRAITFSFLSCKSL